MSNWRDDGGMLDYLAAQRDREIDRRDLLDEASGGDDHDWIPGEDMRHEAITCRILYEPRVPESPDDGTRFEFVSPATQEYGETRWPDANGQ